MKRRVSPLLAVLVTVPLVAVTPVGTAHADTTPVCRSGVPIITVRENGDLLIYQHEEPEGGQAVWSGGDQLRGTDWFGKTLAGPDGVVYSIPSNGTLKRFRWNGAKWDDGGVPQVIGTEWQRYTTPEYVNRITVDETGRIYIVDDKGLLKVYLWNNTDKTWLNPSGDVVAEGWGQYDSITAGGAGVLYARKATGELIRFRYHPESQRFVQSTKQVGTGWNGFKRIFSPGGDVLYGVRPDGVMLWYRYIESTDSWVGGDNTGVQIGQGWGTDDTTAMSDACKLTSVPFPERVTAPLDHRAATRAIIGKDGVPQYFYVDSNGQLLHGRQVNSTDPTIVHLAALPGGGLTRTPAAVLGAGDRLQAFVLGQDGETRTITQAADFTTWSGGYSSLGGWTPGPASFVRGADNLVRGFAVDSSGGLWTRAQATPEGRLQAWTKLNAPGLSQDFTVVRTGDWFEVVARDTSNNVVMARYDQNGLAAWRTVPGGQITGMPAAVVNTAFDGRIVLFARRADGRIYHQRDTASGFTGAWTAIGDLKAVGNPAAAVDRYGRIHVSARGDDTYVHVTAQQTPNSSIYQQWRVLEDARTGMKWPSDTDTTMLSTQNGDVLITFRDSGEVPYFFQTQAVAPTTAMITASASTEPIGFSYIGGPAHR